MTPFLQGSHPLKFQLVRKVPSRSPWQLGVTPTFLYDIRAYSDEFLQWHFVTLKSNALLPVMNILVFPAVMREAQTFAREARMRGGAVVEASSVSSGTQHGFAVREYLPFVTETSFVEQLLALVHRHGIQGIYTPHPVVWNKINEMRAAHITDIVLLNDHPAEMVLAPYRDASDRAIQAVWRINGLDVVKRVPPQWFQIGLLHALERIPGQSSVEKLSFMASLTMNAPLGDIVEIGSLWGRSAFALAMAAQHAVTGPVVCIDPWQNSDYQQPASNAMLAEAAKHFNAEKAHDCFLANLAPFAGKHCNYMRMRSVDAIETYTIQQYVTSAAYGRTPIHGRISLLHIDGNHDFAMVDHDLKTWGALLVPGGWLVLDDYRWPFGDGPQWAGNAWLVDNLPSIDCALVAFDCLWVKMRG